MVMLYAISLREIAKNNLAMVCERSPFAADRTFG